MAAADGARNSTPQHGTDAHSKLSSPPLPLASAQRQTSGTPRPSVSPLSSVSAASRTSSRTMTATPAERSRDQQRGGVPDYADQPAQVGGLDDEGSSELSEPDDDEDEEAMDTVGLAMNALGGSMARIAPAAQEDDSEAETERLDQTPLKQRKPLESTGRTPSKLATSAAPDDELSDPPSPLLDGAGAASSTSTDMTAGQKRKRSDTADSPLTSEESDVEASPRKRSHGSSENALVRAHDDPAIQPSTEKATIEDDPPAPIENESTPQGYSRLAKSRKGKGKAKKPKELVPEPLEVDRVEESVEPTEEQSDQDLARAAEDEERLTKALAMFTDVASQFVAFKEKMYDERLAAIDAEMKMLAQPVCTHPEYLRQVACVDSRLHKQLREARAFHDYKLQSIRRRTLGERAQIQSQYYQTVREVREQYLYQLGEAWYNIQKERRQNLQANDSQYLYRFPTRKSTQIRHQAKYNHEVSILSGVAKHLGFPAAPEIKGVEDGLEEDLRQMRMPKRVSQPVPPQQPYFKPSSLPPAPTSEREAHNHFLEQNAWARPQAPILAHSAPNLTHTPDWAEPAAAGPAKHVMRNLSGLHRTGSPYATPVTRRMQLDGSSSGTLPVGSDSNEPPSSVQGLPPSTDRMGKPQQSNSSQPNSPLNVFKHRVHLNGNGERELTGFRHISNTSGASTIDAPIHTTQSLGIDFDRSRLQNLTPKSLPGALPLQSFETSHLHRMAGFNDSKKPSDLNFPDTVGVHGTFRASDGAFGTPAPLIASQQPPSASATTGSSAS